MAGQQDSMSDQTLWFWNALNPEIESTLSDEQKLAINRVVEKSAAQSIPSDIRLSFGSYFLRIIAGKERRDKDRLQDERSKYPVFITQNLPLIIIFWGSVIFTFYYLLQVGLYQSLQMLFTGLGQPIGG